VHADIVVMSKI